MKLNATQIQEKFMPKYFFNLAEGQFFVTGGEPYKGTVSVIMQPDAINNVYRPLEKEEVYSALILPYANNHDLFPPIYYVLANNTFMLMAGKPFPESKLINPEDELVDIEAMIERMVARPHTFKEDERYHIEVNYEMFLRALNTMGYGAVKLVD